MNNELIKQMGLDYVMKTYSRHDYALVRGKGSYVWDANGKKYLDMVSGIAVNNVGHCHPQVVKAIQKQAELLIHCSNLYWNEPQVQLAKMLADNSCGDKAFFCNSGTEANEAAIKLARRWSYEKYGANRYEIITAVNSFHGRTLGALTATGQTQYQQGFQPLLPGFKYVPFNDLAALKKAITPQTCALLLEPVQGEGGVHPATKEYLTGVKALCAEKDLLLLFDEVQTGLGRTGKLFAYQHHGVEPDAFTLAKGLGGGVPIGALIARGVAADVLGPGQHAATFGGNPLAAAAALATLTVLIGEKLPQQAAEKGQYLQEKLLTLKKTNPLIKEVRGLGLMLGIELFIEGKKIQDFCQEKGLLINCVQSKTLRLIPPLNIAYEDLDKAMAIIGEALTEAQASL
ncbi:MAG: acetylornithine transaminase [Clostridia bacterium]|jgi:acetylornithine/N-succinyldiaminopimelate aminotransferase|nr:acetylornithine transaminase [Clostridia bacterium]MDD4146150.1 acetylornithine transaminase [Clostridia bacterium]MDD4665815.1 acetylornithine transaminase [Clostridia bacterium]